ncbi:Piwi domain-containing protein [Xylariomycetidae sp. FL0641]|nr:Piwi domain-containing protein [Xylariomycetidae sp. FL0641]
MSGSSVSGPGGPRNPALSRVGADMGFDGASDRPRSGSQSSMRASSGHASGPGSRRGSVTGSPPASPRGSQGGPQQMAPGKRGGFAEPLGYDPARMDSKPMTQTELVGKLVDLPPDAYLTEKDGGARFTPRPGYNNSGRPIQIALNTFAVAGFVDKDIFQYDVTVSPNEKDSRALIKKVWNSAAARKEFSSQGGTWLFDGNKLAWSSERIPRNELRLTVDLDRESGKPANPKRVSVYYLKVLQTKAIRLAYLKTYLDGKIPWDNHVLECMNLLDHCIRQFPSERLVAIRRNFYPNITGNFSLAPFLEARKGFYSAIRLSESIKSGGTGLSVNVDVANTAFWSICNFAEIALRMANAYKRDWQSIRMGELSALCRPHERVNKNTGQLYYVQSEAFEMLRRLHKLKFEVHHRGKTSDTKVYTCKHIVFDQKYGQKGARPADVQFEKKQPDGSVKMTTIWQHFFDTYNIRIQYADMPVLETTRGAMFPLEVCNVLPHQRYMFKLSPNETSAMIKFAVTRPNVRKQEIMKGLEAFSWRSDPYLNTFGIRINDSMQVTKARVLPNPTITFGANAKIDPKTSGRWDLRGKKFLEPNMKPLGSWSFVVCNNSVNQGALENFANQFSQTYRGHGGQILKPAKTMIAPPSAGDFGKICEGAYNMTGSHFKSDPQIIFFIVGDKNATNYERIKKNMDCRFALPSQVLNAQHVQKAQGQYMSNVAMKVNAKLGGVTCKVAGPNPQSPPFFQVPTMMIGADVSHASPGSSQPSIAAMTVSMDKFATRYAGAVETNGYRTELVQANSLQTMLTPLIATWRKTNKVSPQHIYYLRDGVSEGQFSGVIRDEVSGMKRVFREAGCQVPKFTVIIATKRHHIRFFPKPGDSTAADRNNNPLPGTLVERDCTHPHHFDFYLCSHVAIQGTARPVHYQVILDEANCKVDQLQKMLYEQCYQYCRSTTPVSLHPAVYYSHLASQRGRAHENIASSQREEAPGKNQNYKEGIYPRQKGDKDVYGERGPNYATPLLTMRPPNTNPERIEFMTTTMWYV